MLTSFNKAHDREPLNLGVLAEESSRRPDKLPESFEANFRLQLISSEASETNYPAGFIDQPLHGLLVTSDGVSKDRFPDEIPIQRLDDFMNPAEKRRFVNRVYGSLRWREFRASRPDYSDLIDFHSHQKLLLLAHDPSRKEKLGRWLSERPDESIDSILDHYRDRYFKALEQLPTRRRHLNVLEHIFGYLTELLPDPRRNELMRLLDDFKKGDCPLIEPLEIMKKEFEKRSISWVNNQSYMNPTKHEIRLRGDITDS